VLTPTTTPAQNICEATGHTFAWLVNPFTPRQFLQEYWEQTPLFIPRKQPGYYADLLSFRDLDSLLASGHRRLPGLRLIKAGTDIAIHRYSPEYAQVGENLYGVVNIDRVFAEHQGGATIILESVHRTSGTVSRFCREMEDALSHPIQANLYLTPKAAQGFEAHYDTHDVFILQVAGCKKWRIFPPRVRLPLRSQAYAGDHDALAPPLRVLELAQGDLLYIPRGYIHEAMTQSDDISAHITVAVIAYTWTDLLQEAIKQICEREQTFRQSLPIGFSNKGLSSILTRRKIAKLTNLLRSSSILAKSLDALIDNFVSSREPILHGHLCDQQQINNINLTTMVKIRDGLIYRIQVDDKTLSLTFHGKRVHFPHHVGAALHYIVVTRAFRVESIPNCIDTAGKLVLIRRLVKEGFLTMSSPVSRRN
jgi:ribosomal protein L16 Arg81 hydroxylase